MRTPLRKELIGYSLYEENQMPDLIFKCPSRLEHEILVLRAGVDIPITHKRCCGDE